MCIINNILINILQISTYVVVDYIIFGQFICIQFENYDNILIFYKHLSLLKIFKVMPLLQNTAWQNIICGSKNNTLYMQCMLLTTILPSYGLMVFLIYVFNWVHGCCCMDIVLPIQKWMIIKDISKQQFVFIWNVS